MAIAENYWRERYGSKDGVAHHSQQNLQIATDFMGVARTRKPFADALNSERIIEVGCGTGEFAMMIKSIFSTSVLYGTDFSRQAVRVAQKRHPATNFWVFDILKDEPFQQFDLVVSSNTLEHFADPLAVVDRMFGLAPLVMLLVPYRQPVTDTYEVEGGAGHAVELNEETFSGYVIVDSFLFSSYGWQHSSAGEPPQQLAILLRDE